MTGDLGNAGTLSQNQLFLKSIFGEDFKFAHVCGVRGDPSKKESGPWSGGYAHRVLANLGAGTNNYFTVSLFSSEQRRINTFEKLVCLAVDDVGPKLDADLAELLLGPPTWIVETSRDNFQWGYKLETPITDAGEASALIHRVRVALTGSDGKDPGMEAVTRYVRLPTGLNLKGTLGQPWRVRLIKMEPSIGLKANTVLGLIGARGQGDKPQTQSKKTYSSILRPAYPNKIKTLRGNLNADDPLLISLRKLGLVLGQPRETAMGWGFDVICPWVDEHTDRAETGTVYVAGAGKFKCQHGHCADRTVEDLRGRVDQMLRDNGHPGGLIHEEFDVVDPASAPEPPQGLKPKPGTTEVGFFNRYVTLLGRNRFYDLTNNAEVTHLEVDNRWTRKLVNVLPRIQTGKVLKALSPSRWLLQDERGRRVNGLMGWPGKPRVVTPDPDHPSRQYVNTWEQPKRPVINTALGNVDELAIKPWLDVFWYVIGDRTVEQWEIGETLLDWMALVLGDQSQKSGWHVLIMGQQGVGKDTMILPIAATLGAHWAQTIQSQQIGADFNEWAGRRLVQISETRQNTRGSTTAHDVMAILKAIFDNTRQWITVNPKYMPKHTVRNVVMGWFTSNESEPLMLEPGDRRFLVLDRTGTKPLSPATYAALHHWLTFVVVPGSCQAGPAMSGIERIAEFLYRRWDNMDDARKAVLFGPAPMTPDKQALLTRLTPPIEDWITRCIALDGADPLTFPDIVTAGYVHSRLFMAIKTGGEGIPSGVTTPSLRKVAECLKAAGAVVLNDGKQIKVNGSPVVLWAVRNHSGYKSTPALDLAKLFSAAVGGTSAGTIN